MLVLTRKIGEEIDINNGAVTIKVLEVRSGQVKLGITAEKEFIILRKELVGKPKRVKEDKYLYSKDFEDL